MVSEYKINTTIHAQRCNDRLSDAAMVYAYSCPFNRPHGLGTRRQANSVQYLFPILVQWLCSSNFLYDPMARFMCATLSQIPNTEHSNESELNTNGQDLRAHVYIERCIVIKLMGTQPLTLSLLSFF